MAAKTGKLTANRARKEQFLRRDIRVVVKTVDCGVVNVLKGFLESEFEIF